MMPIRFRSISARLNAYILLSMTMIFVVAGIVVYVRSQPKVKESAATMATLQLGNILYGIDKELFDVERTVAIKATEIERNLSCPDSLIGIVERMVRDNNRIMGGCVAFEPEAFPEKGEYFMEYVSKDTNGNLQRKHLGGDTYDYHSMGWYSDVRLSGQSQWSEPYYDDGGGDRIMTTFSLPLTDHDGRFFGVITADIALEDFVRRIESLRPYPDSYTAVVSKEGMIIAHPDKAVIMHQTLQSRADSLRSMEIARLAKASGDSLYGNSRLNLNDIDNLVCYSPLDRTGWMVFYVCPYDNILASLGTSALWWLGMLALTLLVILIVASSIIRGVTRPITHITDTAYAISDGNFETELPEVSTHDEIRRLRDAFSHMQTALNDYIARLTETTRTKERIESELAVARKIQMGLVPRTFSPFVRYKNLELFAQLIPAKEVGGDFYDFFFRDGRLIFAIGDVSGKGVPASLFMSITRTLFRVNGNMSDDPARIVGAVNSSVSSDNDSNMFVTMFVGVLDLRTGNLDFCNAGHNSPIIISGGEVAELDCETNLPVGAIADFVYTGGRMKLASDDVMLLYTDGIVEAEDANHRQFGLERLIEILHSGSSNFLRGLLSDIVSAVREFENSGEQFDDLTLMAFSSKYSLTDDGHEIQA